MTAQLLDGIAAAAAVKDDLRDRVKHLTERGITPGLGTILVGDDPASDTYVTAKRKACEDVGIHSIHEHLSGDTSQKDLLATIARFNANPAIDAFIVQLPLPMQCNEEEALLAIDPNKDADGLHPVNLGRLVMGVDGPVPCTPAGIQELLATNNVAIEGKHVVIVGRGLTIGRPLALLLTLKRPNANAAVTVVHTGVPNMAELIREGDIVVSAAGSPGVITADMIKPGAAVVGGGITRDGKKILSDLADDVAGVAGWVTPRIGGVGPMTVALLLRNTVIAAERHAAS